MPRKHLWRTNTVTKSENGNASALDLDITEGSAYDENKSYSCSSYDFTNSFEEIDFEDVGC